VTDKTLRGGRGKRRPLNGKNYKKKRDHSQLGDPRSIKNLYAIRRARIRQREVHPRGKRGRVKTKAFREETGGKLRAPEKSEELLCKKSKDKTLVGDLAIACGRKNDRYRTPHPRNNE